MRNPQQTGSIVKVLFQKYWTLAVFTWLLYFQCNLSGVIRLLQYHPLGEHVWAQSDRLAVAYNYYANDASFFLPQTQRVADNPSGIEPGEFPLLPWLASLLYRLFGLNEFWFRLLTFCFSIAGFYIAFFISQRLISSPFLALSASLSWLGSGYLFYFTSNFLPDPVSLTFLLASFAVLISPYPEIPLKKLGLFCFFASLALLLKTSAVFLYLPVTLVFSFFIWRKTGWKKPFLRFVFFAAVPLFLMTAWLFYAKYIQQIYNSRVFLLSTRPPASFAEYVSSLSGFMGGFRNYYSFFVGFSAFAGLCFLVFNQRKKFLMFHAIWFFCICGWLVFFWIFCKHVSHHSYYHVPFFFIFFLYFLAVFMTLDKAETSPKFNFLVSVWVVLLFILSAYDVRGTINRVAYHFEHIQPDWYGINSEFPRMGVKPDDVILSCQDPSMNISLYFMRHKGWTYMNDYYPEYVLKGLKACDYAVLTDSALIRDPQFTPYFGEKVGTFGILGVYKLIH